MKSANVVYLGLVILVNIFLSACAGPKLPTSGALTVFDGMWSGTLEAKGADCAGVTTEFQVKYGQIVGKIYQKGSSMADFWGKINPDGKLDANIGLLGVSAGGADIKFIEESAGGTWFSKYCKGNAYLKKM
ncbi:hypothetical protein [Kiloniella majae]|uniref:hypothetical protein n=1 Tax=Kiloniella majae TaxID=1938558 RepID=UPI000A278432|nr:hypothetical protein [Kiloniella majae]